MTELATIATGGNAIGLAIESGGTTALVTLARSVLRVNLGTGVVTQVANDSNAGGLGDIVIEAGGTFLVTDAYTGPARVARVDPTAPSGPYATVATGLTKWGGLAWTLGLRLEAGGGSVLVVDNGDGGRLLRIDTTTGVATVLAANVSDAPGALQSLDIESGGTTALLGDQGCLRAWRCRRPRNRPASCTRRTPRRRASRPAAPLRSSSIAGRAPSPTATPLGADRRASSSPMAA